MDIYSLCDNYLVSSKNPPNLLHHTLTGKKHFVNFVHPSTGNITKDTCTTNFKYHFSKLLSSGIRWYYILFMVLDRIVRHCVFLHGIQWYYLVLHYVEFYCMALNCYCMVLYSIDIHGEVWINNPGGHFKCTCHLKAQRIYLLCQT